MDGIYPDQNNYSCVRCDKATCQLQKLLSIYLQEPDTATITKARKDNPKVIINVGGLKHEVKE